ncbi:MAG: hypothetical protein WC840_02445 [Candidatus Peribacteraceae bacterium]
MQNKRINLQAIHWWTLVLYVVAAISLLPLFRYNLNNDAVAYLSIATKEARGDFALAVNAYWSPLFPWALSLPIRAGIDGLLAARILAIIIGAAILLLLPSFFGLFPMRRELRNTTIITAALLLLAWAMDIISPDLLLVLWLLLYFRISADDRLSERWWWGAACGLLGGLLYLTKSVGLPFFLIHFTVLCLGKWIQGGNRLRTIGQFLAGIVVCSIIAAPWIFVISAKKGAWTFGESARVIHASYHPLLSGRLPMYTQGLLPPPDATATSMWDDPTTVPRVDWSPLDSRARFLDQMKIVALNAAQLAQYLFSSFWLLFITLGSAIILSISRRHSTPDRRVVRIYLLTVFILLGAYLPIVVDTRYFWGPVVLSLLLTASLLSVIIERWNPSRQERRLTLALFLLSFVAMPLWNLVLIANDGRTVFLASERLAALEPLAGKRIAADNWKMGLALSHFLGASYFGQPRNPQDVSALESELLRYRIEYYLAYKNPPAGLKTYREIPIPGVESPRLLKRRVTR